MRSPFLSSADCLPLVPPFIGHVICPLPLLPLQLVLGKFLHRVCSRHPQMFDRLGPHARKRFGIDPIDLPFAFVVQATAPRPRLMVIRELPADLDARISSSLANLLALLEGRLDGDALMFSRQLAIEGDVEAVLALRNAIDDARLDLTSEISLLFGPLRGLVRGLVGTARDAVLQSNPSQQGFE